MKPPLYWIKVGLLIGLGFFLFQFLLPIGLLALPFVLLVLLFAAFGILCRRIKGASDLKSGWAERNKKA